MIPVGTWVLILTPLSRRLGDEAQVISHLESRTVWGETLRVRFADGTEMSYSEMDVEVLPPTKET